MNFDVSGTHSQGSFWDVDAQKHPTDETHCLEVLKGLAQNPGWVDTENAPKYCQLLLDTQLSDSAAGKEAKKIQQTLLSKHSELFDLVTVQFANLKVTDSTIPKFRLGAISDVFKRGLAHNAQETKDKVWKINAPMQADQAACEQFVHYLRNEQVTITEDNLLGLLDLASQYQIPELTSSCVAYINEHAKPGTEESYPVLEYLVNCPETKGPIGNLKWAFLVAASEFDETTLKGLLEKISPDQKHACEAFLRVGMKYNKNINVLYNAFSINSPSELEALKEVNKLCAITSLYASSKITDKDLQEISKICGESLEKLSVAFCNKVTLVGARFPALIELRVSRCSITDEGLRDINKTSKNLKTLALDSDRLTSFKDFAAWNLVSVKLKFAKINQEALQDLCKSCATSLEDLDITFCPIEHFHGCQLPKLQSLMAGGDQRTNESLQEISRYYGKTLRSLTISSSPQISSFVGCDKFPQLRYLAADITGLTSEEIEKLGSLCGETLEELILPNCKKITSTKGWNFPKLTLLYIWATPLAAEDLNQVQAIAPNAKIITTRNFDYLQKRRI